MIVTVSATTEATPAGRGAATRERILDAAGQRFAENGFRRTRLEDIASDADVSRALVHAYFENKENLLRRVRDRALAGWRAAVEPEIDTAGTAREKLRAMVGHTLRYARTRPFLQAILADDGRLVVLGPEPTSRAAIDTWRDRLIEVLHDGIRSGEFRQELDVESTADSLRAMQMGIIDRMHRRDAPIDVSNERHIEAATELIERGLLR